MMQRSMQQTTVPRQRKSLWLWLGPLLYMVVVGFYLIGRYGGMWAESDTSTFTNVIRVMTQEGRLVPEAIAAYPNGYAYQVISMFIVGLTGLDVAALQQLVYPLLAAVVVLPAWLLYRELTGSARGATISTILLFIQPEFLFVILRSSHEKFTRALLIFCFFWLVRSIKLRDRPAQFAVHVGLFYFTAFTFITSNNMLAHSFIFAIIIALGLGWLLEKRSPALQQGGHLLQRLSYAALICFGFAYLFTFYFYAPAKHDILIIHHLFDRTAALLLDVERERTSAYAQVASGWINLPTYFLLSVANWMLLITSFIIWARQGVRWLWRGEQPPTQAAWLMWLFYTAFAAQGAFSVLSDASGALGNLQHRAFSSFSIIATALVGGALVAWRPQRHRRPIQLGLTITVGCLAFLSVQKAVNEPLLSNKWIFYRPNELTALGWSDVHLQNVTIWNEFDERLATALVTTRGDSENGNLLFITKDSPSARNMLVTTITRLRSSRLQRPLPVPADALQVYDNGEAQFYHVRPQTPYQR